MLNILPVEPSIYHCPVSRYSFIAPAAFLPCPMARITVAAPSTISPPAKTPFLLVLSVSSSATIFPHLFISISGVVLGIRGLDELPMAIIHVSIYSLYSLPLIGIGRLLPELSGSPSSILIHSTCFTQPFSSPIKLTGF